MKSRTFVVTLLAGLAVACNPTPPQNASPPPVVEQTVPTRIQVSETKLSFDPKTCVKDTATIQIPHGSLTLTVFGHESGESVFEYAEEHCGEYRIRKRSVPLNFGPITFDVVGKNEIKTSFSWEDIPGTIQLKEGLKGTQTKEGYLIFYEWTAGSELRYVVLKKGYGMMLFNDTHAEKPAPCFELYDQKRGEIYKTSSVKEFKKALSRIPAGQRLHHYYTCGGGRHGGLDQGVLESIHAYCKEKGITIQEGDDELFLICTCGGY